MKRLWIAIVCMCFMIFGLGDVVNAATPRVMVADYKIKEEDVISGKEFTLTITMQNTAKKAVKNMKVSIATENGELLPTDGAGTAYVAQIDAESTEDISFQMLAASGLEEKSYKLTIKTEYEGSNGYEYTVDEAIFIPVMQEQRISVTDIFLTESYVQLGDIVEISAEVNNMGAGMLRNVTAVASGDNIEEMETYVGNIESGKSGTIDLVTKACVVTGGEHQNNTITIAYEDQKGNKYEKEVDIYVTVSQPVYEDLEKVKDEKDYSDVVKKIVIIVVVVALFAGGVWLALKKQKKKQEMLDEFMK